MKLYKYVIKRMDSSISVGDELRVDGESSGSVKVLSIVKIDTDEMVLYFYGVLLSDIDEESYHYSE